MIDSPYIEEDDLPDEDNVKHVDLIDTSHPITRDLSMLIHSCYIVEAELRHQVDRLGRVKPRTQGEAAHTENLKRGYNEAYHNVKTLRRYHEGRKHRAEKTGSPAPVPAEETSIGPVFGTAGDDPHGAR